MSSYTVLVRRYQNQGITLPSRASSPSDSRSPAPLSNYPLDDDYSYESSNIYNDTLMPPHPHGTSAGSHRSWSSFDSEASVSAWSHPQDYSLPITVPAPNMTHTTHHPIPDYAYAPPHHHASGDWNHNNWISTSPNPHAMHAHSPISYSTSNTAAAQPHYDDYAMHHHSQPLSGSTSYSRSSARASYPVMLPNAAPTSMPRARAWSEQQGYDSLEHSTYPDLRLQQNPLYRF
jgi:hypothetical protein